MTPLLPAQTSLTTGDLVAFSFPYSGRGSKIRTCAVVHHDHVTNELVVAYGTSNLDLRADLRYALVLQSTDTLAQAGLHQPTRLQIDRRIRVEMTDRRFIKNRLIGTARLGRLAASMTLELINCYAALPIVAAGDERVGIHPKPSRRGGHRRAAFLGRRPVTAAVSGEPRLAPKQLGELEEGSGRALVST